MRIRGSREAHASNAQSVCTGGNEWSLQRCSSFRREAVLSSTAHQAFQSSSVAFKGCVFGSNDARPPPGVLLGGPDRTALVTSRWLTHALDEPWLYKCVVLKSRAPSGQNSPLHLLSACNRESQRLNFFRRRTSSTLL